eukprot:TRINITY_DN6617_c1_g1_i1.p1 TRINITY_DN6617_c1_g1~~TRINITY_DN6617_c1_g1_i1.p1  ORF type:complete len:497 (-),score=70.88 TRINITY_DN6617_c1_g1_i1:439-1929(-)
MPDDENDLLACSVCFDTYRNPQLLGSCGHTFCKDCIDRHSAAEAQRRPWPGTLPQCPTCRAGYRPNTILPNFALQALLRQRAQGTSGGDASRGDLSVASAAAGLGDTPTPASASAEASPEIPEESLRLDLGARVMPSIEDIASLGAPVGLAKLISEESRKIALRIFLLDNSGSTAHPDGQILEETAEICQWRRCTRWEEIVHTALQHAKWNFKLGVPCEFVLLNPLSTGAQLTEGIDFQRIDASGNAGDKQLEALEKMLGDIGPRGCTPLSDRLQKIRERLKPEAMSLARNGQQVILVMLTDGLPTGSFGGAGEREQKIFINQLRKTSAELPVHLVVRLCTEESHVVDFYNSIDEEVEIQLEVIDDMRGESNECRRQGNRWIAYSPLVHRLREGGTFLKAFDLLDERKLVPMEVWQVCNLLLQHDLEDPVLPTEPADFCREVRERLEKAPKVYDPSKYAMVPPVVMDEVEWAVIPKGQLHRQCGEAAAVAANCNVQ